MSKRRKTLRLEDDEVAVIGRLDQWQHLVQVYTMLAEDAPAHEKQFWYDAAGWITQYLQGEGGDIQWDGYYGEQ